MVNIRIDSVLTVEGAQGYVRDLVRDALTIENPDFATAEREMTRQKPPRYLSLYREDDGVMILPRGFLDRLEQGLSLLQTPYDIEWQVAWPEVGRFVPSSSLRPYQRVAVAAFESAGNGIIQAPPGAGKTEIALAVIGRRNTRAIVVVNRTNLVSEWERRAEKYGIGGRVEVVTAQGLWSRRDIADDEFYSRYGILVVDEVHHLPAQTYRWIGSRFPANWRMGLSATPDRDDGLFPLTRFIIGDVVSKIDRESLYQQGWLVRPEVEIVKTDFEYDYKGTTQDDVSGAILRNNYAAMMDDLIHDSSRNELIAQHVQRHRGRRLVISSRKDHLKLLWGLVSGSKLMLTADDPPKDSDRDKVIAEVRRCADCVLFSTLAYEALDIPELEVIYLTYPTRNHKVVEQEVGRIERIADDKTRATVVDFVDQKVHLLRSQAATRRSRFYNPAGFKCRTV